MGILREKIGDREIPTERERDIKFYNQRQQQMSYVRVRCKLVWSHFSALDVNQIAFRPVTVVLSLPSNIDLAGSNRRTPRTSNLHWSIKLCTAVSLCLDRRTPSDRFV